MTWEEFEIYKNIEELISGREYTDNIEKKIARQFGIGRNHAYGVYVKGGWLLRQWEKGDKKEQNFIKLKKEEFENTVKKYGRPKFIGGVKCY